MVEPRYRIGTLSRLSGVSTHLIRVWERRYDALEPDRSGGGARLYAPADLERLRLLKRAVELGHAIGQVARLDRDELERLSGGAAERVADDEVRSFIDDFTAAVQNFESDRAEDLLVRASLTFSPRALVFDVFGPLLAHIGSAWAGKNLCIASEHLASALIRDSLTGLLRRIPKRQRDELAAVATPEGENHELGALLAAVTIAIRGYRILYLGPNLPDAEIVRAARESKAAIVALSVVSLDVDRAVRAIRAIAAGLPEHVDIVLGGLTSQELREGVGPRVLVPGSLLELDHWLEARSERSERSSGPIGR